MLLKSLLLEVYKLGQQYETLEEFLEMPYGQVDKIAKMIPVIPANPIKLSEALKILKN